MSGRKVRCLSRQFEIALKYGPDMVSSKYHNTLRHEMPFRKSTPQRSAWLDVSARYATLHRRQPIERQIEFQYVDVGHADQAQDRSPALRTNQLNDLF